MNHEEFEKLERLFDSRRKIKKFIESPVWMLDGDGSLFLRLCVNDGEETNNSGVFADIREDGLIRQFRLVAKNRLDEIEKEIENLWKS